MEVNENVEVSRKRARIVELWSEYDHLPNSTWKVNKRARSSYLFTIPEDPALLDANILSLGFLIEDVMDLNAIEAATAAAEAAKVAFEKEILDLKKTIFGNPLPELSAPFFTSETPCVPTPEFSLEVLPGVWVQLKNLNLLTLFRSHVFFEDRHYFSGLSALRSFVGAVLLDCLTALNAKHNFKAPIRLWEQASLHGLFPELFSLQLFGHVGVVEVKKPSTATVNVFSSQGILCQVYEYLRILRMLYGIRWCFCILTTYVEWAICYLHDCGNIAAIDEPAVVDQQSDEFQNGMNSVGEFEISISDSVLDIPSLPSSAEPSFQLQVSEVISYNDLKLAYLLASVVYKMAKSPRCRVLSQKGKRMMFSSDGRKEWADLRSHKIHLNDFVGVDVTAIYLLKALGEGAEGKCFLACDEHGRSCVAKFHFADRDVSLLDLKMKLTAIQHNWHTIFGIPCAVLNGQVLVVPFFRAVEWTDDTKARYKSHVVTALRKIAAAKRVHADLRWDHVMLKDNSSTPEIVIVDLNCIEDERAQEELLSEMETKLGIVC